MVKDCVKRFFYLKLVPSIFVGVVSCISFYSFYLLHIDSIFALMIACLFCGLTFFVKGSRKYFVFLALGFFITFIALMRYSFFIRSPKTLLPLKEIKSVAVELTGEPKPASRYYAIDCRLLSVYDNNGNSFSAKGNAKIFFPKAVIEQNLSGGISLIASKDASDDCRIFASGVVLKVNANYAKSKAGVDCFFAKKELPSFVRWSSSLEKLRGTLRFNLMRLLFSWGPAGALLMALISADKNFLANEVNTAFISCGLAHVLALSGMHVSIVSGTSEKLTASFFSKKFTRIFSLVAIMFFVWFAGAAPSLNRALGMAAISIFASLLNVRISVLSTLCTMFLFHIVIKPEEAIALSFMLSYGALAGILLFGEALNTVGEGKIPESILSSFSASFGAQAFTLPIIAFTIKRVSLIGLLSSSLVSPLIGYFLILGLAFIFVCLIFVQLAPILGMLLNYFYNFIMLFVNGFAGVFSFVIDDNFTAMMYVIVPLLFGIVSMYFQNKIMLRRDELAKSDL